MVKLPYRGPPVHGQLFGGSGQSVPYEIRRLDTARLSAIDSECNAYMAGRVGERSSSNKTLYEDELVLRMCAEAVRHTDTGEPLASLAVWRRLPRSQVGQCAREFAELIATEQPSVEGLEVILVAISKQVSDVRSSVAHVLEDCRILFARDLSAYFGEPAARLSIVQIAYYVHYRATLNEESRAK